MAEFENWVQGAGRDRARSRKTTPPTHMYGRKIFCEISAQGCNCFDHHVQGL